MLSNGQRRIIRISYENVRAHLLADKGYYDGRPTSEWARAYRHVTSLVLTEFDRTRWTPEGRLVRRLVTILKQAQTQRSNSRASVEKWQLTPDHFESHCADRLEDIVRMLEDEVEHLEISFNHSEWILKQTKR
jgi:hypothetical protein